jgi:ribosome-binding ATPase YchF (GTP1/OBG family)
LLAGHHGRKAPAVHTHLTFCDVAAAAGRQGQSLDEHTLRAMREVDAVCQVVRGFPSTPGPGPFEAFEFPIRFRIYVSSNTKSLH